MRSTAAPLLVVTACAVALLSALPATIGRAFEPDEELTRGEALFLENECADCHVHAVEPGQPTLPLAYLTDRFDEERLAAFLSAPPRPMPNPKLSRGDRLALARYLLATFP